MDLSSPSKPKEKTEQQGRDDIHNFSVKEVHSNHYNYHLERDVHPRHRRSRIVENVLVLQGGGSLGAFGCGVYKALARQGKRFDIVAGTSIGAVNAAIIAGSKSGHPRSEERRVGKECGSRRALASE